MLIDANPFFTEVREHITNTLISNGMVYEELQELSSYYKDNEEELDKIAEDGDLYYVLADTLNDMTDDDFLNYANNFEIEPSIMEGLKKEVESAKNSAKNIAR